MLRSADLFLRLTTTSYTFVSSQRQQLHKVSLVIRSFTHLHRTTDTHRLTIRLDNSVRLYNTIVFLYPNRHRCGTLSACPRGGMSYATDLKEMEGFDTQGNPIPVANVTTGFVIGMIQVQHCDDIAHPQPLIRRTQCRSQASAWGCLAQYSGAEPIPGRSLQTNCHVTDSGHAAPRCAKPHEILHHAVRHENNTPTRPKTNYLLFIQCLPHRG
jgi:hypothetical protein